MSQILSFLYSALTSIYASVFFREEPIITKFTVFLVALAGVLCLIHVLVILKVELARKLVVVHAYMLLLEIPVGTIMGVVLLKSFRSKNLVKHNNQHQPECCLSMS